VAFLQSEREKSESPEVRQRLRRLIDRASSEVYELDRLAARALQVLELSRSPDALALLREYAAGTPEARMTVGAKGVLARIDAHK
jgi:hypothetical protein